MKSEIIRMYEYEQQTIKHYNSCVYLCDMYVPKEIFNEINYVAMI